MVVAGSFDADTSAAIMEVASDKLLMHLSNTIGAFNLE
jgi:hypothetical protein